MVNNELIVVDNQQKIDLLQIGQVLYLVSLLMLFLLITIVRFVVGFTFPGFEWLVIGAIVACMLLYYKNARQLDRLHATNDFTFWKWFFFVVAGSGLAGCVILTIVFVAVGL